MSREKKEEKKLNRENFSSKEEARKAAIAAVVKNHGEGAAFEFAAHPLPDVEAVPTGSLGLDIALGVGGYPRGRIIEIYGPESSGKTTLTLHAIAQVQKAGGAAAFIDAEHALDPSYARALGVDMDAVTLSQPDNGEQALDIAETFVASGGYDIVIVDSVAALVPKAEIEGEMGDSHMGLQARLMSQALRKLTAITARSNTILVFINQTRMKIGVMFGCFHADTLVSFADGSSHPIRTVVEKQLPGPVIAWDEKAQAFVTSEIVDWHRNGDVLSANDFLHVQTTSVDGHGRFGFTLTPDHQVLTTSGWKAAKELRVGESLRTKYESKVNGTFADFIWGTLVGDAHIAVRDVNTASLRFNDKNNPEYLQWKANKVRAVVPVHTKPAYLATDYRYEWAKLAKELGQRDPVVFLRQHYSPMGLALWWMDDGHFDHRAGHCRGILSVKRLRGKAEHLLEVQNLLLEKAGLHSSVNVKDGSFRFNKIAFLRLCDLVAPYVPPCMQYKLPVEYHGKYEDFTLQSESCTRSTCVEVVEVRTASSRQMRQRGKYDITVAGQHTYLVGGAHNGVVVHNSPETTTGGNALKFYSSLRLEIRRVGTLKNGEQSVGNRTRVKIVKNKVAPPFREVEFDIMFGKGINYFGDLVELGTMLGLIEKSGAWYSYQGERIGQGAEKATAYVAAHPDLATTLDTAIRAHYRLKG